MGSSRSPDPAQRRLEAERRLRQRERAEGAAQPEADARRLVHELQVHQIELEMQNEELERTRDDLEYAVAQFTDLYDHAPVGYLTLDAAGTIRRANFAAARLIGSERSLLAGRRFAAFVRPSDQSAVDLMLGRLHATSEPQSAELALVPSHGRPAVEVQLNANLVGVGLECRVLISDLTESRRAEEERKRALRTQMDAQRVESLGRMAGALAHRFNNHFAGVIAATELVELGRQLDEPGQRQLAAIRDNTKAAAGLCRQLLAMSGSGRFMVEAQDLSQIVRPLRTLLESSVPPRIGVVFACADGLPAILADAVQVHLAAMNLLTNAAEAIGDFPGTITVSTGVEELAVREVGLRPSVPPGRYVFLRVEDTGCGMDAATQARLGESLFTTKEVGRGIGLAAVYGILQGHHGALRCSSVVGRGTTMTLLFPAVVAEPAPSVPAEAAAASAPRAGRRRILLVDDDDWLRETLGAVLEELGFDVVPVADGDDAVRLYNETPERFDVVLMDVTMKHMDGTEALHRIRQKNPGAPVILMSGYSRAQSQLHLGAMDQASDFLTKPFDSDTVLRAIERALNPPP
jgi:PAS domain S-box-containing protein